MSTPATYTETFGGRQLLIGISGIIGAGKSTLTKDLASKLGYAEIREPVAENPYLPLFYKDMSKYGFAMQVFLLNKRFHQHQGMIWSGISAVQDRTIYEDVIFAKMLHEAGDISDLDFETYKDLFSNMTNFLHRPDVIVYLDVEPKTALERITNRGRECEKGLPLDYLSDLKAGYEDWLKDIGDRIPIVRIDWNEFQTTEHVIDAIRSKIKRSLLVF